MSKKYRKRNTPPFVQGVGITKERYHQNGGVISEPIYEKSDGKTYIKRHRTVAECTVDYYLKYKKITIPQHRAATIVRHDYQRAVLHIKTDDYSAGSHGDHEIAMLVVLQSDRRLREAYAVLSKIQKAIIIQVCGHDDWATQTYKLKVLRRGLDKLVKLWKLS